MPALDATTLALLASVLVLLSGLWLRQRQSGSKPAAPPTEDLDTIQDWPPQAVRVMTLPERQALEVLRKGLPRAYLVLSQVPLSRFISVPIKHSNTEWQRRAGRLCPDLLVCDASSRVIAAVEVRSGEQSPRARTRHERIQRVLQAAGIPVHVWNEGALPTPAEARAQLLPKAAPLPESDKTAIDDSGRAVLPLPEIEELLADGDAFARTQLPDPVSSGYFDDLEAGTAAAAR